MLLICTQQKAVSNYANEIADQHPRLFMVNLDVESHFTNITLEESTSVCYDPLFSSDARVNNTSKIDFEKLLRAALQRNFFNLDVKIYRQIEGVVCFVSFT